MYATMVSFRLKKRGAIVDPLLLPGINDLHPEACRVMTKGDTKRWLFLSHFHTIAKLYFLLAIYFCIVKLKMFHEVSEYAETYQCIIS